MSKIINDLSNKALKYYDSGQYNLALDCYYNILKYDINNPQINHYVGLCYFKLRNYIEAEKYFKLSLINNGNFKPYYESIYDLFLSMAFQNKIEAFKHYKGRYMRIDRVNSPQFPLLPIIKIENVKDLEKYNNILILNEQGYGDEFLFSKSLYYLVNNFNNLSKIDVQIYDVNLKLFNEYFKFDNKINYFSNRVLNLDFIYQFDCWIPFGDLFAISVLEGSIDNYKMINLESSILKKYNYGFSLYSNPKAKNYKQKSFICEDIFYDYNNSVNLNPYMVSKYFENPKIIDFNDTLNIILKCNKIISVDTSVSNLAGLTNIPTYLIYKEYLDWRYIMGFYPNITPIKL